MQRSELQPWKQSFSLHSTVVTNPSTFVGVGIGILEGITCLMKKNCLITSVRGQACLESSPARFHPRRNGSSVGNAADCHAVKADKACYHLLGKVPHPNSREEVVVARITQMLLQDPDLICKVRYKTVLSHPYSSMPPISLLFSEECLQDHEAPKEGIPHRHR